MVHAAGHLHCSLEPVDVERERLAAGAQFDLVYARLLLFQLTDSVAALAQLWDWVAPGGHLVVQDDDLRPCGVTPPLRRWTSSPCDARRDRRRRPRRPDRPLPAAAV